MILETMIDSLRSIMESKKKIFHYDELSEIVYPELTNKFTKAINKHLISNLSQATLNRLVNILNVYIIKGLVKADEEMFKQKQIQLTSSFSGFLELAMLVDNDEEILDWLGNEENWRDCFLVYSDPSLLNADIYWSITKALCLIEDGIYNNLSFTSESIISALHHILICFASLFERQNADPKNIIMLLHSTKISACYGKGNGNKHLKEWEQKEIFSKFFADKSF